MKSLKKILIITLAFLITLNIIPLKAEAATIKLNKTKTTVYIGSSTTLKLTGTKSKPKWTSSKKSIAAVNSRGKITAKKIGSATITAKIGRKSYRCKVTVKNPYLNSTNKTLTAGKTFTLKITGTLAAKWTSNNKSVATVSSKGKVSAKKAGSAIISCKGKNGKTYKCKITVNSKVYDDKDDKKHTHKYTSTVIRNSTCEKDGIMGYDCKNCPEGGSSYTEIIPKTGHKWDKGKETKKSTCIQPSEKTYTCTVCGGTKKEYGKRGDHKYKIEVFAVCTLTGYTKHTCTICNYSYKDNQKEIKHEYIDKITKQPTCEEQGITTYNCKNCNYSYTVPIEKKGHNLVKKEIKTSCAEEGYTENTCNVCGYTFKSDFIAALPHDLEGIVIVEATNFRQGVKKYQCKNCNFNEDHQYGLEQMVDIGSGQSKIICGYWAVNQANEGFRLLNEYRMEKGKAPLVYSDTIGEFAKIRALECAVVFEHDRPNGESYPYGENIAGGYQIQTALGAMNVWKQSSHHNDNMLDSSYKSGAVGCFRQISYIDGNGNQTNEFTINTPIETVNSYYVQNFDNK